MEKLAKEMNKKLLASLTSLIKGCVNELEIHHERVGFLTTYISPDYDMTRIVTKLDTHAPCVFSLIDMRAHALRARGAPVPRDWLANLAAYTADVLVKYIDPCSLFYFNDVDGAEKFKEYTLKLNGAVTVAASKYTVLPFVAIGEHTHAITERGVELPTVGLTTYYRVKPNVYVAINAVTHRITGDDHIAALKALNEKLTPSKQLPPRGDVMKVQNASMSGTMTLAESEAAVLNMGKPVEPETDVEQGNSDERE